MALRNLIFTCFLLISSQILAQLGVGTNSPNSAAQLDVTSTSKGVLFPRMTNAQMLNISSPATGLQVFNTTANTLYYYNGSQWQSALNSYKTYANAGNTIQFDNLKVRIPSSGNRSLEIATVTGTVSLSGVSKNIYISTSAASTGSASTIDGYTRQGLSLSTTLTYWQPSLSFPMHGSSQEIILLDETNNVSYRIICIIGSGYSDNFFEIERLK